MKSRPDLFRLCNYVSCSEMRPATKAGVAACALALPRRESGPHLPKAWRGPRRRCSPVRPGAVARPWPTPGAWSGRRGGRRGHGGCGGGHSPRARVPLCADSELRRRSKVRGALPAEGLAGLPGQLIRGGPPVVGCLQPPGCAAAAGWGCWRWRRCGSPPPARSRVAVGGSPAGACPSFQHGTPWREARLPSRSCNPFSSSCRVLR